MSYTSQMPFMRTKATEDGIVVNDILKYYRVSLLRAQVRLDLDLSGQLYVAEHQTWASFWPGEPFPGIDPRAQVQVPARTPTTAPAAALVVGERETTTCSTILKEISIQRSPSFPLNNEPQSATPTKSPSVSQESEVIGRRNSNRKLVHEHARNRESQENGQERQTSEKPLEEYKRSAEDNISTHLPTSPPTPSPASKPDTTICGNCSEVGHSLADCTHNIDEYGFLNGCPRCNTREHNYADCLRPKQNHDNFYYLISKRHGRPPLRCSWDFRTGYWAKFKGYMDGNATEVKRPQTAAFAKERRDSGVVQAWDEIVLDPSWYKPNGWANHVEDQVHPLDKARSNASQVVDLSGSEAPADDGLVQQKRKRSADGSMKVDEYGRLAREESSEGSPGADTAEYVQKGFGTFGQSRDNSRDRSSKPTMQPWKRNRQAQRSQDERSWKKRRAEDQRNEGQRQGGGTNLLNHGTFNPPSGPRGQGGMGNGHNGGAGNRFQHAESNDPFLQMVPEYRNGSVQGYGNLQEQSPSFQHQGEPGLNRGRYIFPSSTPGQHPLHLRQGFGNSHPQQISHSQMTTSHVEQQTPVLYNADNNPFPPIFPTRRNGDDTQANLGPVPGWKTPRRQGKPGPNNGQTHFSLQNQNNGNGANPRLEGFKNQNQGQRQMTGRSRGQGPRGSFGHQNGQHTQISHQGEFQARTEALTPAQPPSRADMQVDGLRAQAAQRFSGFGTQHGIARPTPLTPGPINTVIGETSAFRGPNNGGQKDAYGMQNSHGGNGQGNQQFNAGPQQMAQQGHQSKGRAVPQALPLVPQPGLAANAAGYCANCRSSGHVAEECGGSCILCRAGGHKARECRFFGPSVR
ncbi:hypothetical protein BKA61DRAFT_576282 [Leptodontidium sp. MPI-SDFR-AT-0119]|nr:hypothetical protein BKA61DRAFT_576282 [Leptodontidium sp. MPI-SDFR-AT-0119]